tara:strand:+ start:827 stop:1120 length:294 start_codon:yes stop_codon:yes gene_type:complete
MGGHDMHTSTLVGKHWNVSTDNSKLRAVLNLVIRERIAGGNDLMEAIAHFRAMIGALRDQRELRKIAQVALDRLNGIRDAMCADIINQAKQSGDESG